MCIDNWQENVRSKDDTGLSQRTLLCSTGLFNPPVPPLLEAPHTQPIRLRRSDSRRVDRGCLTRPLWHGGG